MKARFEKTDNLRKRLVQSRTRNPRPPRSFYKRYDVVESASGGRPIFTISRRRTPSAKRLLYFHGGGYTLEIFKFQWEMLGRVLDQSDVDVTVPLYPLTPEHTCVDILEFAFEVYRSLANSGFGARLIIMGDSSGGGLALALSQKVRDSEITAASGLVLISPWLDVTCADPAQPDLSKNDPILALATLREEGRWYAGDLPATDPRVSPIYGDVGGLPPILLMTGTHDLLNADAHRLRAANAWDGREFRMIECPDMLHVWPSLPIPEAKAAISDIAMFIRDC